MEDCLAIIRSIDAQTSAGAWRVAELLHDIVENKRYRVLGFKSPWSNGGEFFRVHIGMPKSTAAQGILAQRVKLFMLSRKLKWPRTVAAASILSTYIVKNPSGIADWWKNDMQENVDVFRDDLLREAQKQFGSHKGGKAQAKGTWRRIGEVVMDSGRLIIVDPTHISRDLFHASADAVPKTVDWFEDKEGRKFAWTSVQEHLKGENMIFFPSFSADIESIGKPNLLIAEGAWKRHSKPIVHGVDLEGAMAASEGETDGGPLHDANGRPVGVATHAGVEKKLLTAVVQQKIVDGRVTHLLITLPTP